MIDAPEEKVWAILSNIGSVQDYSPGVVKSFFTSDIREGVGASRHCDLLPRGTVEERIASWYQGKGYSIEIYDGTDLRYTGVAHFKLANRGKGTIVTQSMDYAPTEDQTGDSWAGPIRKLVGKVVEGNLAGLKHFVETGEIVSLDVYRRITQASG